MSVTKIPALGTLIYHGRCCFQQLGAERSIDNTLCWKTVLISDCVPLSSFTRASRLDPFLLTYYERSFLNATEIVKHGTFGYESSGQVGGKTKTVYTFSASSSFPPLTFET